MSGITELQVTASLYSKVEYAMDYALKALQSADPLVPFAISWRGDSTTIERYMLSAYDDSIEMAMHNINEAHESMDAYAIVWTGYIETDNKRMDAVIIEAGELGTDNAVQLAQAYTQYGDEFHKLGDMLALGDAPCLLSGVLNATDLARHLIKPAYVSTEGFKLDVASQPFAQMPAAIIYMAANLCAGSESSRLKAGIRKLQELEGIESAALSHRVFTVITSLVVEGDFKSILKSEDLGDMANTIVEGAAQLEMAVQKGLVGREHVAEYFHNLIDLLYSVLTEDGKLEKPVGSEQLYSFMDRAMAA